MAHLLLSLLLLANGAIMPIQDDKSVKLEVFVGNTAYTNRISVSEKDTLFFLLQKVDCADCMFYVINNDKAKFNSWNSDHEISNNDTKATTRGLYQVRTHENEFALPVDSKKYNKRNKATVFYIPVRSVIASVKPADNCFALTLPTIYNSKSDIPLSIHPRDKHFEFVLRRNM